MRGRVCGVNFGLFFDLGLMAGSEAELFFFVVAGLGEAWDTIRNAGHFGHVPRVNQMFDGVGRGRSHRREDSGSM